MRSAAFGMVLVLVLLPMASANDPNARTPQAFEHPVTAIALSGDGGHVAIGMEDEGGFLSGDSGQEVWILSKILDSGLDDKQGGDADDEDCGPPFQTDDMCSNSVDAVALSQDGRRMVVASIGSDEDTTLVFAHETRGEDERLVVPGEVSALGMSSDGQRVVVALGTNVRYYDVGTGAALHWERDTDDPVTALAVSRDGERVIAAAGGDVVVFERSTSIDPFVDTIPSGTVRSVAISDHNEHYAIAGISTGAFRLYSDTSIASETIEANIRGSSSVDQVAFDPAGRHFALARENGGLDVFGIEENAIGINLGDLLAGTTLDSPARDLRFSGDGEHLLVRRAEHVEHRTAVLEMLWSTSVEEGDQNLAMVDAAISDDGARVAALAGGELHVFEAFVDLDAAIEHPGALTPGQEVEAEVTLRNQGNRIESVQLDVTGPAAWGANLSDDAVRLLPGESAAVTMGFVVPVHGAPGGYDLELAVDAAQSTVRELAVEVLAVEAWSLDAVGNPTSLSVQAGQAAEFTLTASNDGNVAGKPPLELTVGTAGWSAELVEGGSDVPPGAETDVLVRLQAPTGADELDVGNVRVRIDAGDWIDLQATVGASFGVRLVVPGDVDAEAGDVVGLPVTIRNTGNAPDRYRLTVSGLPTGWSVTWNGLGDEAVTQELAPDASVEQTLSITVPAGTPAQNVALDVVGQSLADDDARKSRPLVVRVAGGDPSDDPPDKKDPGFALLVGITAVGAAMAFRRKC